MSSIDDWYQDNLCDMDTLIMDAGIIIKHCQLSREKRKELILELVEKLNTLIEEEEE